MAHYLWKSRHGVYYFRVRIPLQYQAHFNYKSEFRQRLPTAEWTVAKRLARKLMVDFDHFLDRFRAVTMNSDELQIGYDVIINTEEHPSGVIKHSRVLKITPEEHAQLGDVAIGRILAAMSMPGATEPIQKPPEVKPGCPLLSEISEEFLAERNWSNPKTKGKYRNTFKLLIGIVGDKPFNQVTKADARLFKQSLEKLPVNISGVHSPYKGMTYKDIIASEPAKKLSTKSIHDHIINVKAIYNWLEGSYDEFTDNPFTGIKTNKSDGSNPNKRITSADIAKIFSCYLYTSDEWPRQKKGRDASKFWIPLILAFTGCRLNEACQLYLDDISKDDFGTWLISFNDSRPDQSIKAKTARIVPLHETLLRIGFLEYVNKKRKEGEQRLFPELTHSPSGDGYGRATGEFCRQLLKDLGVVGTPHSFRHTVIQMLTQAGVALNIVQALVGHTGKAGASVTELTYGANRFSSHQLKSAINKLEYGHKLFEEISYGLYKKRTAHL